AGPAGNGGSGGGIFNSGTLTATGCVLTNNCAGAGGGSLSVYEDPGGTGFPAGDGGSGGAVCNVGSLSLTNCIVIGNSSGGGGGPGCFTPGGTSGGGGGIANRGSLTLSGCTFSSNEAAAGSSGAFVCGSYGGGPAFS